MTRMPPHSKKHFCDCMKRIKSYPMIRNVPHTILMVLYQVGRPAEAINGPFLWMWVFFFAILLDAESVEHYVGELQICSWFKNLIAVVQWSQQTTSSSLSTSQQQQQRMEALLRLWDEWKDDSKRRQVDIAKNLQSLKYIRFCQWQRRDYEVRGQAIIQLG